MKLLRVMLVVLVVAMLLFVVSCEGAVGEGGPVSAPNVETWASLLPLLVPFLIMFFQQAGLSKRTNGFIALGLCVIAVAIDGYFFHGLGSITDWYGEMGLVVSIVKDMAVEVFVIYELMKKVGLADWVTEKTTLRAFRYRRIR